MNFIKKNIKYIGIIMICIFCSYLTTIATNYAFDSSDVRFDNTGTNLDSVNVQDALDETFHHVTDYNEIKTTIGNDSLTTTSQNIIGALNEVNSQIGNHFFKKLAATTNLNNITDDGVYLLDWVSGGTSYNRPINQGGRLIHSTSTSGSNPSKQQSYLTYYGTEYIRGYYDGTWTNWKELVASDQIANIVVYKEAIIESSTAGSGDVITVDMSSVIPSGKTMKMATAMATEGYNLFVVWIQSIANNRYVFVKYWNGRPGDLTNIHITVTAICV